MATLKYYEKDLGGLVTLCSCRIWNIYGMFQIAN